MSTSNHIPNDRLTPPAILTVISNRLESFAGEEKTLAEYIILNYAQIPTLSLVQLAQEAQVSPGTVRALCKDIGLEGYHSLHDALAEVNSVAATVYFEGIDTIDLEHLIRSVFENIVEVLEQTLESLDMSAFQQAIDAISQARQIAILGVGTSVSVAAEFAYRLEIIGLNCNQYQDAHRQLMSLTLLEPGDVVIGISHSGRTKGVVNALRVAQECGLTTICLTDFSHSPVTEFADIRLVAVHAERNLGVEMAATRTAHLALIDAVATAVALKNKERTASSLALNERLLINLRY